MTASPEPDATPPSQDAPTAAADPSPADEGAVGAAPEPSRRSRVSAVLPLLALAALTALVVLTGFLALQVRQERQTEAAREQGLVTARDAARVLFSYDHRQLDEDFEKGLALAVGDFREEYERTTREVVRPVAEQYDAVVQAEVVEAAVVSARPDEVVAIVFINQTTTSTRVDGPKIDQSRVRMTLRPVDGQWRVADVRAL